VGKRALRPVLSQIWRGRTNWVHRFQGPAGGSRKPATAVYGDGKPRRGKGTARGAATAYQEADTILVDPPERGRNYELSGKNDIR